MSYINMSCGQTFLSPSCLKQMNEQVNEPIYYPKYYETEIQVVQMLKQVYKTKNITLITTGTGTYGIEMGLRSTFERSEKVAVIDCGTFGAVAASILSIVGLEPVVIHFPHGAAVDLDRVRDVIAADSQIRGLYAVHDETTTGIIAPIAELGKIAREKDLIFAVDAISSISGVELKTDEWGIDLCFGSAQKCMNGPQGLVTISISPRALEKISSRKTPIDTLSLDLTTWIRYHEVKVRGYLNWWKTGGPAPAFNSRAPHEVSPSATLVWGLKGALEDILCEGLDKRIARHAKAGRAVRRGIAALGLPIVAQSEEIASDVVTVVRLPNGIDEREFRAYLLNTHQLALGNGEIGNDNVRIGTMGMVACMQYVLPVIAYVADGLEHFGFRADAGAAMAAVYQAYAEQGSCA